MLANARLETLVFFVADLPRSAVFYRDVLGLTLTVEDSHEGSMAIAQAGSVTLVLLERAVRMGDTPIPVFSLDGGIDDCADALVAKGVEIVTPVSEAPDGGLTLDFLDPDGTVLSLHQPMGAARRR
ncbi:VOC family protein [Luteimonas sp. RC10]|uniref:VOC family protein n=1 Tax=Luteimonas sp. RC10 TaxID=2587035 RepID=UPI00161603FF|nr:VOC family protein [Luteimonas sp. RC10]MBB3345088.1 putative enzyme related to lactoylglutathione lyase [Luteimonas sp. RC10]